MDVDWLRELCLSFKASPENFAELTERQNIIPAPYMARAQWVALQTRDALTRDELSRLLRESYELVFAKLPRKTQEMISGGRTGAARAGNKKMPISKLRRKKALKKKAAKEKRAGGR